jgi:hypothetical protein
MKDKKSILIFTLVLVIIVNACERDRVEFSQQIGNLKYTATTKFISSNSLFSANESELVFDSILSNVLANDFLVINVSEKTPDGLLKKVTDISQSNGKTLISVEDACLCDVILNGEINISTTLHESGFWLVSKSNGVQVKGDIKGFDGVALTLVDYKIPVSGGINATINGSVGVEPAKVDIKIKFSQDEISGKTKVESISARIDLNKIDELSVSANNSFIGSGNIIELGKFKHNPVIQDGIIFNFEAALRTSLSGNINSACQLGVRQDRQISAQLNYDGSWLPVHTQEIKNSDFIAPALSANSDLKTTSGPEFKIMMFDKELITINSASFFELKANKALTPWWKLNIGGSTQVKVSGKILGTIMDYTYNANIDPIELGTAK